MDILNLQLGHSELVYLLWLMKTLSIPGIGPKPFGDISGEQVMASLASAEQSLQARGLIGIEDTKVTINQQALILVGTCAMAKASLVVQSQNKESTPEALFFHYHSKAWVRHSILEKGVHKFDLIESPLGDFTDLLEEIHTPTPVDTPPELTLPQAVVEQVFTLFSNQQLSEANTVLEGAGFSADSARLLVDTLSDLQQKIFIGITYHNRTEDLIGDSTVLIRNSHGYWQAENVVDTHAVNLIAISRQEIIELFNRLVEQARQS